MTQVIAKSRRYKGRNNHRYNIFIRVNLWQGMLFEIMIVNHLHSMDFTHSNIHDDWYFRKEYVEIQ